MTQRRRLAAGGRIDRSRPIEFSFNGRRYQGYPGDTLASALLANGVTLVGRSFKYHRPRGIVTSGSEEPNALVQIGEGAATLPNQLATQVELYHGLAARSQNCWPTVGFDLLAGIGLLSPLLSAGFYYKTFMWPRRGWKLYERLIRSTAGLGESPRQPDPDRYVKMNAHCDVLVVGAGPAGLVAALAAARAGARVLLADKQAEFGGSLLDTRESIDGRPAMEWCDAATRELAAMADVRLLPRSTVFGYYDHNFLGILERGTDHLRPAERTGPRERLWRVRARQVVLATGALERPLVFGNNDRPGVMLASAVSAYINRYAVAPGNRGAVVFTNNDGAYRTAVDLADAGVPLAAVVDVRPDPAGALPRRVRERGIAIAAGSAVVDVRGGRQVAGAVIAPLDPTGQRLASGARVLDCDLIAVSGGWTPTVHLHCQAGGRLRWDHRAATFLPGEPTEGQRSAGACRGATTLGQALADGAAAGAAAAAAAGQGERRETIPLPETPVEAEAEQPLRPMWMVPCAGSVERGPKQFVDFQEDVSSADIVLAAREGFDGVELVKRYTTLGMGTDQGKLSNLNGLGILAQALGKDIPPVGTTKYRPPYTPTGFGALAGRDVGPLFDPVRQTALHQWHEQTGARFETVGQWLRPWYYPHAGEGLHEAVRRECLAARKSVGLLDASTLGKIDVQGPDAAEFLDRIYTSDRRNLAVGRCRYGLMLGEDGMVMDDGVTARLGRNHFLLTTTTGGAARVMGWLERWFQTEWPGLRVYLTSVTDHWATISIAGPDSRRLLRALCPDVDFTHRGFPFMALREGTVAGVAARIFRISFSGELAYEVNLPADYGRAVWEALMDAGRKYDITPYGTETMHVLRAEKGYIIVGQETDGSMAPGDLGLDWLVARDKDFLGKRSLTRPALVQEGRKQLVGLSARDPGVVLPEGGQIVTDPAAPIPTPMVGHVTSSYHSPTLGRSIALAVVRSGRQRRGETVYVSSLDGPMIPAVIADPVFYDPEGARQHPRDDDAGPEAVAPALGWGTARRESPLVGVERGGAIWSDAPGASVQLRERPFLGHLNLRADPADRAVPVAVERVLGCALPVRPNTVAEGPAGAILWLGPTEWLLVVPTGQEGEVARSLREALGDAHAAITDLSSGQTIISLSGAGARDLLAQGCPLDLHPRVFGVGRCAQTHVAKAAVAIWLRDDRPTFDLIVRRSFAGYLALWLEDAAR